MNATMLIAGTLLVSAELTSGLQAQVVPEILDLDRAIEIALSQHGDLGAATAATEARAASTRQAGFAPNPVFTFQTENWRLHGEPGFRPARDLDVFAWMSLPVETAGKRNRRVELAVADEGIAEHQRQLVAWSIRQAVKKVYWQVLAAEADVEMLELRQETLQRLEDYHEARVRQGATAEVNLIRVRVDVGTAALALSSAQMDVSRARIDLLEAMGLPVPNTGFALTRPKARPVRGDSEDGRAVRQVVEDALVHRLEIRLGQSLLGKARAAVALQQSLARPDVTPFLGYKRTGAFDTVIGGLSIALPVRDRNAGGIQEALVEVRRQEAVVRATEARVRAEVVRAVEAVRWRADMLLAMEFGILDDARESARIARAAYEEGGSELLDVLDAQRSQDEIALAHSRLAFDYQLSWVDLETAAGTPNLSLPLRGAQTVVAGLEGRVE